MNTVLKEELQTLDQFPISEESVNKMCKVVENLTCSDVNENIYQLLEDHKQFSTSLFDTTQITTKIKYNTVDNLKCKEFNLSTL